MTADSIIEKTIEYLTIPAVVGFEQVFLKHLQEDFKKMGLSVFNIDGVLSVAGKDPSSAIICAHVDRHGLISLGNGEYAYAAQYIKEIKYGENNRSSYEVLEAISERFVDEIVYAYDPETGQNLGQGRIQASRSSMQNGDSIFHVHDMPHVDVDIPLAYERSARKENGHLKGQIDNALSLGVVHALFANGFEGTALLTTEEEIGKSWIHIMNYMKTNNIESKDLLVLDTSPYNINSEPIEKAMVIFRNRDKSEIFNPALVSKLKDRCEALGLPFQVKDEYMIEQGRSVDEFGSTELGRLVAGSEGRWNGATVQIPTHAYHTSNETTTGLAILNCYNFLHNILVEDNIISSD
ncbi:MAG: peptidase M42 [Micavibrio sp.]|nr:MAG: peptidase M42 [Micavibrio sp.]